MSQRQILVLIGIIIMILPVLGFPMVWKQIFFAVIGLSLIYVAFKGNWKNHSSADTFLESHNQTI